MQNSDQSPPASNGCRLTAYRLFEHDTFLKIVPAPADRFWMDFSTQGWANRCLPLRIANQAGWHVLNNTKFDVEWNGKADLDAVKITFPDGQPSRFMKSNFGYGILTWYLPYLFRTSPGYNLLVRGPANLPKDGVSPLEGLVETDWTDSFFAMSWKVTRVNAPITFVRDEPICLLVPMRRGELEVFWPRLQPIESDPEMARRYDAWRASRWQHIQQRTQLDPGEKYRSWQSHYIRGVGRDGERSVDHQARLVLRPF